ncbi:MAG: hypothetical protein MJZ32_11710, partial [Bacteroidaceae bacterium]|nr:hypothetical protein [Bacteroidaceae bacterium]
MPNSLFFITFATSLRAQALFYTQKKNQKVKIKKQMKQTKQFKRTAFNLSAKSMVSTLLLLIAMLMPQGAWAIDFISEIKVSVENGNSGSNAKRR